MNTALQFNTVNAGYRENLILKDLSLSVTEGEFTAIIGPNGAGKTTLLRVITGLLTPSTGSVSLFGEDVANLPADRRATLVGVVPQEITTPMAFTVEEIVTIGRTAALSRWRQPSAEDFKIVQRAMVYTDVADMKDQSFSELSGGEKQRAVIAMVLAQEPRVILMDEATSHLDINHRLEVMQIVERLNKEHNVTVLMVSHDLNLAAEFTRRLVLMDHGSVVSDGTAKDVLTEKNLRHVYHCDVHVQQNAATGSVTVVPASRLSSELSGQGIRIHVICGGGCGEEIMRRLNLCNYEVTCGVLNRQDSDAASAAALGLNTVLEKPFSPVSDESLARAEELVSSADGVIVCGVPFGQGNLVNLDLAAKALELKKEVFIMDGMEERDYTPGKDAVRKTSQLLEQGARTWTDITDLMDALPRGTADR